MNKKIIAIAIATAMAAPVAMADIKITGQIGASLTSSDKNTAAGVETSKSSREMADYGLSKVTIDGTSGDAYARVGMDIRPIMVAGSPAGRDFYLGYKFGATTVQAGRMASAAAGLEGDKYNATFLQQRRTSAVATTCNACNDSFLANPVLQIKTKVGGATVNLQLDPGENNSNAKTGYVGLSVKGKAGPLGYFASYNNGSGTKSHTAAVTGVTGVQGTGTTADTVNVTAVTEGSSTLKTVNTKFGASMKFGAAKATVYATNADNEGVKTSAAALLADMSFGSGLSGGIGYGQNKDKDTWTRLAVTKSLSKGAALFGGVTSKKANGGTTNQVVGFGMKVKF